MKRARGTFGSIWDDLSDVFSPAHGVVDAPDQGGPQDIANFLKQVQDYNASVAPATPAPTPVNAARLLQLSKARQYTLGTPAIKASAPVEESTFDKVLDFFHTPLGIISGAVVASVGVYVVARKMKKR